MDTKESFPPPVAWNPKYIFFFLKGTGIIIHNKADLYLASRSLQNDPGSCQIVFENIQ